VLVVEEHKISSENAVPNESESESKIMLINAIFTDLFIFNSPY
jgi:hypothetical protein